MSVKMSNRTVKVVIPAKLAFNIDKFNDLLDKLAIRIGCEPCFSGFECRFINEMLAIEKSFSVDDETMKLDKSFVPERNIAIGTWPTPESGFTIDLSNDAAFDLNKVKGAYRNLAELVGCDKCTSGLNFRFRSEMQFFLNQDFELNHKFLFPSR